MQITLQDGRHLVNYNKIHKKLQTFVSSYNEGLDNRGSDNQGCTVIAPYFFEVPLTQVHHQFMC